MSARFAWSGRVMVDNVSGKPITNGKINFWINGTTTDQDTFPTVALSGANVNPLILDANGRVPEAWSNDTDVYAVRVLDENDNVILPTVQDLSFISPFTLSSADVLAALAANAAAVDIAGSSMVGSAFSAFADDLTLTAAGSIDTSAGSLTTGAISVGGDLTLSAATPTLNLGSAAVSTATLDLNIGVGRTDDGFSLINLVGDTTFTGFGFRIIRAGTANGVSQLLHRGTGAFSLVADEAAALIFATDSVTRLTLAADGAATFTGDVTLSGGDIIMASGKGIDFSATADGSGTTTSELLDDYEEGTFTPTIIGSAGSGTITYSAQTGDYTKIGRQVYIQGRVTTSSVASRTGTTSIGGFPFTLAGEAGVYCATGASGLAITAGTSLTMDQTSGTTALLELWALTGGTGTVAIDSQWTDDGSTRFSGNYHV